MDRAELIALAAPPCHQCGAPVTRVEWSYVRGPLAGEWVNGPVCLVCPNGHRVQVQPA